MDDVLFFANFYELTSTTLDSKFKEQIVLKVVVLLANFYELTTTSVVPLILYFRRGCNRLCPVIESSYIKQ